MSKEKYDYKREARRRDNFKCQAEGKHKGRLTTDHMTPRCLFRLRSKEGKWLNYNPNIPENLTTLCQKHHTEKDSDTELRKQVLIKQFNGEDFDLEKHMETFGLEPTIEDFELLLEYIDDRVD